MMFTLTHTHALKTHTILQQMPTSLSVDAILVALAQGTMYQAVLEGSTQHDVWSKLCIYFSVSLLV